MIEDSTPLHTTYLVVPESFHSPFRHVGGIDDVEITGMDVEEWKRKGGSDNNQLDSDFIRDGDFEAILTILVMTSAQYQKRVRFSCTQRYQVAVLHSLEPWDV